tara:strand:+ start:131 stop:2329 length:2199 start_codon:yes stop_codon:yes gene_type:complete
MSIYLEKNLINFISISILILSLNIESKAEETDQNISTNINGSIGLIVNPSARFSSDGEFIFGISSESPYKRLYSTVQFFPWLEATLKYTEIENLEYGLGLIDPNNHVQTWKDKGADLKILLMKESDSRPQLALGLMDIGGTGAFSSEYIAGSKQLGPIDLTLGLAWGRMATRGHIDNPIGRKERNFELVYGGKFHFDDFFSGEKAAFFGGIEYTTPIEGLTIKAEYDSNNYQRELGYRKGVPSPDVDTPINYGLNYHIDIFERDQLDISLGVVRGNTVFANFVIGSNLNKTRDSLFRTGPQKIDVSEYLPFRQLEDDWKKYLADSIMWQVGNQGIVTHNLHFSDEEVIIEISQSRFRRPIQAVDVVSRILASNAPKNITKLTVVNLDVGLETLTASVDKEKLIDKVSLGELNETDVNFHHRSFPRQGDYITRKNDYLYPNFYWQITPKLNGTLQHQAKFYFYQLEALLHTEYSFKKGMYLSTDIGFDIYNNFEDYTYHITDGELHHVRQDRRLYMTEGTTGIRRMALDRFIDVNRNIKAKFSVGLLEWMYGGLGGEIIYFPDQKNWAIGLDTYWVKQREFDQKFSFRDYQTVTGFLSIYYDIPFYNMRFKASMGKFLGKDKGAQLDLSRRFANGSKVGAIVSLTDCDSACVGEGSFNKWVYFSLPMDLFSTSSARNFSGYAWSPLTKDAGQKVESGRLYDHVIHAKDEVDVLRRKPWSFKKILSGFSTAIKT